MKTSFYLIALSLLLVCGQTAQASDAAAPSVVSIKRHLPNTATTNAADVTFRVTFSESVTGVDASDFSNTIIAGSVSSKISGIKTVSTTTYDVTVSSIKGNGKMRLDLKSKGTGIKNTSSTAIAGGYTNGETYSISSTQIVTPGFTSITELTPLAGSTKTSDKPQAKVWNYDGRHWAVLANSTGTYLWRLDGTSWTNALKLSTKTSSKADCRVVGNVVHIFLYQGSASQFVSVEYDAANTTYNLWSKRTSTVGISLDAGVETASIDMDGTGRLWLANASTTSVLVRYSDAPYQTWSAPITIATGITDDDICAIVALPGKTGVFWSNQTTKRFGFKTHTDGSDPSAWSTDEIPASQSAVAVGGGMADDHLNLMAASDGTLYCAVKTNYDVAGYPEIALLVRRTSGSWDNLYEVSQQGTRPIILFNEAQAKIRVVYTASDGGGNIVYKESSTNNIAFSSQLTLISGVYDDATSTHQIFDPEVVVLASNSTQTAGALASDGQVDQTVPTVQSILRQSPTTATTNTTSVTFRATFSEAVNGLDISDFTLQTVSGTASGTLTSNAVAYVGTDGTTYDVTVGSVTGDGVLRLDLNSSGTGITDAANNTMNTGYNTGETYSIDMTAPSVQNINRQTPTTENTSATSVTFRAIFSEFVTGVDAEDFMITTVSGTVSGMLANDAVTVAGTEGNTYDITVSEITGSGVLGIELKSSGTGIRDTAGNIIAAGYSNGATYTIEQTEGTVPTVQSILRLSPTTTATNATSVTFKATFSETVNGVDATDFTTTVVSGTLSSIVSDITQVNGSTYNITVNSINGNGVLRLDLNASGTGITNAAGNNISEGFNTGETYCIDQTAPTIQSINRQTPTTANTTATSVTFRITFSETVTGVDVADFALITVSGTVSGTLATDAVASANETTFDLTVSSITGSGELRLDLNNSGTNIVDEVNNATNGGYNAGQTYIVEPGDQIAPTVQSILRQVPTIETTNATIVTFRATFSEAVSGVDAADFTTTVMSGTLSATVANVSLINATTYDVTVTPVSGTGDLRLDVKNMGTDIKDAANNLISDGYTSGESYIIDQTHPTALSISRQSPTTQNTSTTAVTFRVTFSEKVTGVGAGDFSTTVVSGSLTATVSHLNIVGTEGTTYDITVNSINGSGELRLDLKSGGTNVMDVVNNSLNGGYVSGETYNVTSVLSQAGFTTIAHLEPLPTSEDTGEKPQAKVWNYDGRHWAVLPNNTGTYLWRLDGTTWTSVLRLSTKTSSKADCRLVGNIAHIFLYQGRSSQFVSVEYDAANTTYKLWSKRTSTVGISLELGVETASIDIDGTGRIWLANAGTTSVYVRYSDAPYHIWSNPITIATGITDDDMCAVIALPGKIGVFWSNQSTKRFGFKTHSDGTDPTTWSSDEVPASQSAIEFGKGMADDHINLKLASDGTLYCGVKTGYDTKGYPDLGLLVRRPSGIWENFFEVSQKGTRPIVVLNESIGRIRVVYTDATSGGNIVYRESSTSNIAFGSQLTLISGVYNDATSTHQTFTSEVVILASNTTHTVGVLATDGTPADITSSSTITGRDEVSAMIPPEDKKEIVLKAYPNPFSYNGIVNFTIPQKSKYTLSLYDTNGKLIRIIKQGEALEGQLNTTEINGSPLPKGLYLLSLQTSSGTKTLRLMLVQ